MPDLLLEIGLEEVPARMLPAAEAELLRRVVALCERDHLLSGDALTTGLAQSFSTPRRLAVLLRGLAPQQPDSTETLNGPATKIAFKDGQPTAAAEAFARKAGVAVGSLTRIDTPKGEYLQATLTRPGLPTAEILIRDLAKEIGALYWPKNMYWREGKPERFVRPVEWLVCLLDEQIVPVTFAGTVAGRTTRGHRLLSPGPLEITTPGTYGEQLRSRRVLASVEERRHTIRKALDRTTRTVPDARWREDVALVDQVTHLTEWPTVLLGSFAPEFLELPEEVLVTVMRDHQKYFAVEDTGGRLLPHFLTVLNTDLNETNAATIRQGNERVLRARFNDARFFWQFDRRTDLMDRVAALEKLTFHKDLGSYAAKSARMLHLAERLAAIVTGRGLSLDTRALTEAVTLSKADLTTELVKEFTELQGIIGGLYARAEGKPEAVWQAVYDQYLPAGAEGRAPRSAEGALLGIADRIDTLAGLFGLGLEPTGSKDPFALRRAANAIIRILADLNLPLTLEDLVRHAADTEAVGSRLRLFFNERLSFYLKEVRGIRYDVVTAVLLAGSSDVRDALARAQAVDAMRSSADFLAVSAAFKRMKNILEQAEARGETWSAAVTPAGAPAPEQAVLETTFLALQSRVQAAVAGRDYSTALEVMATLRPAVDLFFDKVMVMDPDPALRATRLRLLAEILRTFAGIADFSEVVSTS